MSSSPRQLYEAYFEELALSAESGLFDCLAHPDLVKNASPSRWSFEDQRDLVARALDRIAATGVAMELNTSGRLKTFAEFNPGPAMLVMMKERDIPLVLGSDAHTPERVAEGFEDALEALRSAGYQEVSMFAGRTRYTLPLEQAREALLPVSAAPRRA